jgi:hypothetical protein
MTRLFQVAASGLALALALVAVSSVSAQRRPAAIEPTSVTVRLPEQPAVQGYVGEERCRSCHRAELTQFHKTAHASVMSENGTQRMNCETCHGSGKAHADGAEAARGDDAAIEAASFSRSGGPHVKTPSGVSPVTCRHVPSKALDILRTRRPVWRVSRATRLIWSRRRVLPRRLRLPRRARSSSRCLSSRRSSAGFVRAC